MPLSMCFGDSNAQLISIYLTLPPGLLALTGTRLNTTGSAWAVLGSANI